MNDFSLPPVIKDCMGFYMFKRKGGYSASVYVKGTKHFACDHKEIVVIDEPIMDTLEELTDKEFAEAMGW